MFEDLIGSEKLINFQIHHAVEKQNSVMQIS